MELFDEYILSYEVGCLKPDVRIYEQAARKANASFRDLLYIDDREDLTAQSKALGIDSIRFSDALCLKEELAERGIF